MSQKRPLLVLLLMAVPFLPAVGQQKLTPVPRDFSKEAYTVERSDVRIAFENDGTGSREVTSEIKILADAGVKTFAVLSFTYSSANETVDIDYVRVHKPDGSVVKTPDYNVQDMPADVSRAAPLYSDVHEKHVAVKGLGVGDVLEYEVRYRVVNPEVAGQFWQEYSFTKTAISKDEHLEISVPASKYVKVVSPEFKAEITEENERRIYRWQNANLIVPEKDPNEIPRRIPPNPDVQVTTFKSWKEVGEWYGGLQKDPLEVTPAIQAKAAELTKGLTSDDAKIRALYRFVALKYHYIGLDFGIGRYQPHAADDVLGNGYGDCKDKHTLLAALLKAAGIEAWPALIHSARRLDPDVPSPAQFNHVITVVPRGGEYVWLDTTPEVAPYGLLMQILRDKQALVIPVSKPPLLMTTPANPPFPMAQEFSMEGKLNGEGTFSGHAEQSYRGDAEVLLRMMFRQISESQWKEAVQRFSYGMNFGGDVSNVKISPPDDLDQPFKISYDYVRKNYGDWENSRQITAPLPPMGIEFAKDGREKKPLEPVLLGALGTIVYKGQLELPAGYHATAPADCHLVEAYAEYTAKSRIEKGVMTTTRELVVKKNEVELNEWENFRNFGRAVNDNEYAFIPLRRGATDFTADAIDIVRPENGGGTKEAVTDSADDLFKQASSAVQRRDVILARELLQKVIEKDPKYKGAHRALGALYLVQNKPQDALGEFQKEEENSPDDVRTIQAAAYAANLTGNKDLAIAETRKLLKADPGNVTGASSLAGLLAQQNKYSEAADVLEGAVKAVPDNANLQYQLGDIYLKNKQPEQAIAHMKAAVEQKDDDAMMLNNVAYTLAEAGTSLDLAQQYGQKAIDELDDEAQGSQSSDETGMSVTYDYSLVWDTVGWVYFQSGDVKHAESFIRAAWLLGEDPTVAEHLGEIYEKEGKKQEAARSYEFALAVSPVPGFSSKVGNLPTPMAPNLDHRLVNKIRARYEKLTGKQPAAEIRRLPNGEWTQTPAEQLRHSREVKVGNDGKLSGEAQFTLALKPDNASVSFYSGDRELEPLVAKLTAAHYPLEFPGESDAILVVRLDVSCHGSATCIATLAPPVVPRPQVTGATY